MRAAAVSRGVLSVRGAQGSSQPSGLWMPLSRHQSSMSWERVDTRGLFGLAHFERDAGGGLRVPFQSGTFEIK